MFERFELGEEVLAEWAKGVNDRIVLFVVFGQFFILEAVAGLGFGGELVASIDNGLV